MNHDVGDVAVHKQFARIEADDFIGRDAAVGASDPQVLRCLLRDQAPEEVAALGGLVLGPAAVIGEEMGEVSQASRL